ncbi:glutamine amidotransferase [Tahibacter caeni]|uniref:glutamine amidotransferase n=1 Tax=Tahibacter caeni TaxID=1453545 RepID=UPI0021485783
MSRVLVLQTGSTLPQIAARHGDFAAWFLRMAGLVRRDVDVVRVDRDEALPAPGRHAAILVTGSASMVTERADWSERSAGWLAGIVRTAAAPVLGVCYGHQLLAHGLGGRVDWNPRGRQIGTKTLRTTPASTDDPLFGATTTPFRAQTTHQQSVVELPADALVLAASALDPHQALRFGERAWGLQFHPEFSANVMAGYIRGRRERLIAEGLDPAALLRECGPAPEARRLLRRFVRKARDGAL